MALFDDILNRLGASPNPAATPVSADEFQHVAQNVPSDVLSRGLSAALGSDQTPPAGQMIGQMFGASSPEQRAAMLNQLLASLGPAELTMLRGKLGQTDASAATASTISPSQAANVSPQQVQDVFTTAQQKDPGIVDSLSGFYAQHPGLVKTLGGAALAIMLGRMSQHMRGG